MTASFRFLGLALLLLGLPHAAAATEKVVIAECGSKGCRCQLTSATADEAAIAFGIAAPAAADSVLVLTDGTPEWSSKSLDDIDLQMGGDGTCELELFEEMKPEDGIWASKARINALSCGSGTARMRGVLESNLHGTKPARLAWKSVFDADTYFRAWLAANPDPEAANPKWTRQGPYRFSGRETLEGMVSRYDMELLTPTLFRMNWQFDARNEEGPCRWSVTQTVRRVPG